MKLLIPIALLLLCACGNENHKINAPQNALEAWTDEIIYFVLTDRFADGDSSNNQFGQNEYNPNLPHSYHGGDLKGLRAQIPYLKQLGITSLWLTPPVRNAIWSRDHSVTGYHGYWASHFEEVDPHLGDLEAYRALAKSLRAEKIKLIQDVVTNHVADYFRYEGTYDPARPWLNFTKEGQPLQAPFDLNDARDAQHRKAAIYHFTPSIVNYQDATQKLTWQMSDLDDLNTENPQVIEALKKSFRFWMDSVGIDGIRFDTPLYVDHPFWHQFLHDKLATSPGLKPHAKQLGIPHFYTFGETWVHSQPFEEAGEKLAQKYLGTSKKPEMDGVLNFPLQQSIHRVFAGGAPTNEIQYRLAREQAYFPKPWQRLHFIDNHDMPRFAAGTSKMATRQALAFTLTIPGIPVVYYGTEQGLTETRGNLFGKLDTNSADFKFMQSLIAMRKSSPCFSRGKLDVLAVDSAGAGVLCYRLKFKNHERWVLFNSADHALLHGGLHLGTTQNGEPKILLHQGKVKLSSINAGLLNLVELGPKSFVVFEIQSNTVNKTRNNFNWLAPTIPDTVTEKSLQLHGQIAGVDSLKVFVNGNAKLGQVAKIANNLFEIEIPLENTPNQLTKLLWVGYKAGKAHALTSQAMFTKLPERLLVVKADPLNDDKGPAGTYTYPTAFDNLKSLDFKQAKLYAKGHALRLQLEFNEPFSQLWNPPLGFDHLQLNMLLHWNDEAGGKFYGPVQYTLKSGQKASRVIQINGWQIQSFMLDNQNKLQPISTSPTLQILNQNTMVINIDPGLLGFPASLSQINLVLLSWDSAGEGGFRPLEQRAGAYTFGGGKPSDPLWMDELIVNWKLH